MKTDYDIAYAASCGISFTPERRAEGHAALIAKTREDIQREIEALGQTHAIPTARITEAVEQEQRRAHRLWCAWMGARSRCMSSAIVGPSNFPVRRMAKRWEIEMKRGQEFSEAVKMAKHRAMRFMGIKPELGVIRVGGDGAIEALTREIEQAEKAHACMVGINKVLRRHKEINDRRKALADLGLPSSTVENILGTNKDGKTCWVQPFELSNSSANIRRLKQQLKAAKFLTDTRTAWGWEHPEVAGKVEDGRVWLVFPGKPQPDMIARLRQAAFKWSPSRTAWVRLDTNAARYAAERFKPAA